MYEGHTPRLLPFASKTVEGTKLQLVSEGGQTNSVVVSTLMEAWKVVDGGLVSDGIVKDVGRFCPSFRWGELRICSRPGSLWAACFLQQAGRSFGFMGRDLTPRSDRPNPRGSS